MPKSMPVAEPKPPARAKPERLRPLDVKALDDRIEAQFPKTLARLGE